MLREAIFANIIFSCNYNFANFLSKLTFFENFENQDFKAFVKFFYCVWSKMLCLSVVTFYVEYVHPLD